MFWSIVTVLSWKDTWMNLFISIPAVTSIWTDELRPRSDPKIVVISDDSKKKDDNNEPENHWDRNENYIKQHHWFFIINFQFIQ